MKVHNLTDVATPVLQGAGMVNVPIKLGDTVIPVGESMDFRVVPAEAARYKRIDAIFIGETPPKKYLAAKAKLPPKKVTLNVESKVQVEAMPAEMAKTEPPPRGRRQRSEE